MITRRQFGKIATIGLVGYAGPNILTSALKQGRKLKVVQIGTAHSHADAKVETVRKLNDVFSLVGVVEDDPVKRRKAEQKMAYKDVNWLSDEEIYNIGDLDAALVETDLDKLVPTALRCVNAGLHVHIDKPPGKSYEDFKTLLDEAEGKNLIVQMGYMFRYNPAFRFCLKAVREGWLGQIFEVDGVISKAINVNRRLKLASTYGGGMMLLGCHLIDILIAILGEPESVKSFRYQTSIETDHLYDNEVVIVKHPQAVSTIRSSLLEVEGQMRRQFVVCGTNGTIEVKPLEPPRLQMALDKPFGNYKKGYQTINLKKMSGRYDDQLRDFARLVRGEKKPEFSKEHDLMVHRTLLEAGNIV